MWCITLLVDIKESLHSWDKTYLVMMYDLFTSEKTTFRMEENNSKQRNRQKINLKNIQTTSAAQFQKNK